MFLGTYHGRIYGESENDTIAVEDTYNLLNANKKLAKGEHLPIERENLIKICTLARQCLLEDKTVLRIRPHVHVIGDLKGNYNSIWDMIQTNETTDQFLFLGDYVNYGKNSIEVITLLLCMKLIAPTQVFLLRGSSETPGMTKIHGFKDECTSRYDSELYHLFLEVFDCMPLAAIVNDVENTKSILCLNGGISSHFTNIKQLEDIERPLNESDMNLVHSMLWTDPSVPSNNNSKNNNSDASSTFSQKAVHTFLKRNHLDSIIRSHQYKVDGYEYPFGYDDRSVLTIFSAPAYDNGKVHHNVGSKVYLRDSMLYTVKSYKGENNDVV